MQSEVAARSAASQAAGATRASPAPPARGRRQSLTPYLLLAPTVLFLALFFAWPMVQALVLASRTPTAASVWTRSSA